MSNMPYSWVTKPGGLTILIFEIIASIGAMIVGGATFSPNTNTLMLAVGAILVAVSISFFSKFFIEGSTPGFKIRLTQSDLVKQQFSEQAAKQKYIRQFIGVYTKYYLVSLLLTISLVTVWSLVSPTLVIIPLHVNWIANGFCFIGMVLLTDSIFALVKGIYWWRQYKKYMLKLEVSLEVLQVAFERFQLNKALPPRQWTTEWLVANLLAKQTTEKS